MSQQGIGSPRVVESPKKDATSSSIASPTNRNVCAIVRAKTLAFSLACEIQHACKRDLTDKKPRLQLFVSENVDKAYRPLAETQAQEGDDVQFQVDFQVEDNALLRFELREGSGSLNSGM